MHSLPTNLQPCISTDSLACPTPSITAPCKGPPFCPSCQPYTLPPSSTWQSIGWTVRHNCMWMMAHLLWSPATMPTRPTSSQPTLTSLSIGWPAVVLELI
jgi:hypothetical protein